MFSTVRDANVNVIMISQASSEHSICFAVKSSEAPTAVAVLEKRFADAIKAGRVSAVECIPNCCVLAAVGQGMVARKGAAATMFGALAKANINIKAIAQVGGGAEAGWTGCTWARPARIAPGGVLGRARVRPRRGACLCWRPTPAGGRPAAAAPE